MKLCPICNKPIRPWQRKIYTESNTLLIKYYHRMCYYECYKLKDAKKVRTLANSDKAFEEIMSHIYDSARSGLVNCSLGDVNQLFIDRLMALGFGVVNNSSYPGANYTISWDVPLDKKILELDERIKMLQDTRDELRSEQLIERLAGVKK